MGRVYAGTKIFHFHDKLASLPREVSIIKAPIHIRIKPTNICNHNCTYCAYRSQNLQLGQDMSIRDSIPKDKMMEIIEDLEEMKVQAVTFSGGGEPFCYKYIEEVLIALSNTSVRFSSLTNGARLDGGIAEILASHGSWVRVSIDGWDDESYALYRSVREGEFSKVVKNMENFVKLNGACHLGVSFIVDQRNAPHVFSFVSRMKDIGVHSVKVSPCIVSNEGRENNLYHEKVFAEVKAQNERVAAELADASFSFFDAYHELDEKFSKNYTWCPYLQILPVIAADQRVYSCQDKAYNIEQGALGSIANQRFKDFWFSDKNKFFEINPSLHCNHHCVANNKNKLVVDYLEADPDHLPFV